MTCSCHESKYKYEPVGHVITGDLSIVKDRKLRELIGKGPSYREQNNINWELNLKIFKKSVREYKLKWAKKEKVDSRVLDEWESVVLSNIKKRIRINIRKHTNPRKKKILADSKHTNYLKDFHEHYVLVPADKASNNVLIVCKKYYLDVVLRELDNSDCSDQQTYTPCSLDVDGIVREHLAFMVRHDLRVHDKMQQLPAFYWLPKMHKNPIGSRFIAASSACTTKPLSQLLTVCLKAVTNHFKEYCEGIFRRTRVNCFWIIDNSIQVLKQLEKLNKARRADHFDSFDFSTLYTNIPHDLLLQNIGLLVSEAYRIRGATFLTTTDKNEAYWTNTPSAKGYNINEDTLLEQIRFLVDNIYIQVGNRTFRQTIGIPMGTDCAPLLANLFLFHYEFKFMKEALKMI